MPDGGTPSEAEAAVSEAQSIINQARRKNMPVEGDNRQTVDDFRLDPDVMPGIIIYPDERQIKGRLDQYRKLYQSLDNRFVGISRTGLFEKIKLISNPKGIIDKESNSRSLGFRQGQEIVLHHYLEALGQEEPAVKIRSLEPGQENEIEAAHLKEAFGSHDVAQLLDDYGYTVRLATLGDANQRGSVYEQTFNPLFRLKQLKGMPASEFREWAKGYALGELHMLLDILDSLGQSSQLDQIKSKVAREIMDPEKFKEIIQKKSQARLHKTGQAMEEARREIDEVSEEIGKEIQQQE